MCCFTALASERSSKFQEFGEGLCEAIGETGNKEQSALDKLQNILMLSKGGKLPDYKALNDPLEKKKPSSDYLRLFQRLYGNHAFKVMCLHKIIILNDSDLLLALGVVSQDGNKEVTDEMKNT